jgi:thioredoxin-related protein
VNLTAGVSISGKNDMTKKTVLRLATAAVVAAFTFIVGLQIKTATASESNLNWRSFNEGIAEAKKSNKKVLIDVYTDWCSWCKKMDSQVYGNKDIAEYLTNRYVVIKLNAESDKKLTYKNQNYTERELAAAFGISGYPSTLFLKSDSEPITIYPGFADAQKFKSVLSFIAEDHYLTTKYEDYVNGRR